MGGEGTPGLGPPEDEELLGRVSRDLALCMPEACAPLALPAAFPSLLATTCYSLTGNQTLKTERYRDTHVDRQTGKDAQMQR